MTIEDLELLEPARFGEPPTPADNDMHPAEPHEWWQESALFTYGDAERGFGGEIRCGVQANRGEATLYSWTVVDGEMVDRRFVTGQQPPASVLDGSVAGATVRTVVPLSEYAIELEQGDLSLDVRWRNFDHPVSMGFNVGGASIANGHYNAMGELTGRGRYRGTAFDVHAFGFSDHSWGVRRRHLPASRSLFCVFGPDFSICAIPISTGSARTMVGYVRHGGKLGRLMVESEMGYSFRDDWVTPAGCDARLVDDLGRTFTVRGRTVGPSSSQPMGHGKFVTHAVAGFECEGRRGNGILESAQFSGPPPAIRHLGLEPGSPWLPS